MSKIGDKPITIKEGVTITQEGLSLLVQGSHGQVSLTLPSAIRYTVDDKVIRLTRSNDEKKVKALHGTYSRLLSNAITGVSDGFSKTLEIFGTGYRAQMEGDTLVLALGYSHPVRYCPPAHIKLEVTENRFVKVSGADKEQVGLIADRIYRFKVPDAYRGKGVRIQGKQLHLKPGKAAAKTTTK